MKRPRTAVLVFVILAAELAVFEVTLRWWTQAHPYYDEEMWKYGVLLKRQASNPRLSHEHVRGATAFLYHTLITINSRGLRDREFAYDPLPRITRAMALGDSFTLGWGVDADQTFPKRIEGLFRAAQRDVEVINAGVGNYNSEQEWTYFDQEGFKYHPRWVILLFNLNDAEPTPVYRPITAVEHSRLLLLVRSRWYKLQVKLGLRPDFIKYYTSLYQPNAPGWVVAQDSLRSLQAKISAQGAKLLVALCPELRQLTPVYPFADQHEAIKRFLRTEGIDTVDLLPVFRNHLQGKSEESLWVSPEDSHPNAWAHAIMAKAIFARLTEYE